LIRQEQTKPVSLYWQTGHLFELSASFARDNENQFIEPTRENPINAFVSGIIEYNLGWYPSSQTNVTLNPGLVAEYCTPIPNASYGLEFYLLPSVGMRFNYYFSPQLRLQINYDLRYNLSSRRWEIPLYPFHRSAVEQGLNHSFNVNLFYSLF